MKKKSIVDIEDLSLMNNGEPSSEKEETVTFNLGKIPSTEAPTEIELLEVDESSISSNESGNSAAKVSSNKPSISAAKASSNKPSISAAEVSSNEPSTQLPNFQNNIVLHSYYCQICGSYYASKGPSACVFCGGKQVVSIENVNVSDYFVLPFVDTLNDAIADYKKKVKFNPLVPSIFRKKKTIKRIKKVYIPCVLYQTEVGGKISFLGAEKIKGVKAIPTQTYETGYTTYFSFPKLLLCGYSKVSDEIFSNICDYNYSVLKPFDLSYLKDTELLYSDEDNDGNRLRVENKIMKYAVNVVRGDVPHSLKKIKDNQMKVTIQQETKVFVPAYLLDVRYNGENYVYIKNAHTGKSTIDLVSSIKNIIIFSIFIFIVIFVLLFLFVFLV